MDVVNKSEKGRFWLGHKRSSALVISLLLHAGFFIVAVTLVAVQAIQKEDVDFTATEVQRPQPKLKKLQVPVNKNKSTQAPRIREIVVSKPNQNISFQMPAMVGVTGGIGYGKGRGLSGSGPGFEMDLFGAGRGAGNELVGTFYDLKQTSEGDPTGMNRSECFRVIRNFLGSGWSEKKLRDYFRAPRLKYTTTIMMPQMSAGAAPKAFGVEDQVRPGFWLCHYKGQIAAPETGRYRFCGFGDDVLVVRVGKKVVLNASMEWCAGQVSDWESDDEDNLKFPMDTHPKYKMVIGDWIPLRRGEAVNMDVLIGEVPGGQFCQMLLIEKEGGKYEEIPVNGATRRILPVFKTAQIPERLIGQMKIIPDQATLEGPVFGVLENKTR